MPEALPTPRRTYITQLDALRFFAAFLTAAYHSEIIKQIFQVPGPFPGHNAYQVGANCVTFFFVLSGFLITWLLLRERDHTQNVDVPAFYLRRVFRIWPLYYLIVLSGLFLLTTMPWLHLVSGKHAKITLPAAGALAAWLTFFPNLCKVGVIPGQLLTSHTWSIGMEEQFYAAWPWLVKKLRRPQVAMWAIIGLFLVFRFAVYPLVQMPGLRSVLEFFRFDCMALGGLVAVYYHAGHWKLRPTLLQRPAALYTLGVLSLAVTLSPFPVGYVYFVPIVSALYGAFILALSLQPYRMQWLNHPALRYLGAISYGIYMFNVLACILAINVLWHLGGGSFHFFVDAPILVSAVYLALCLGLTIALAALSYRFLEAPFLRLKDRLAQPKLVQTEVETLK